jgi:hypothetical protein
LGRPGCEGPCLLLVTGYRAADAWVPDIRRNPLVDFARFIDL